MKQKELEEIINRLRNDPKTVISVNNIDDPTAKYKLIVNATNKKLEDLFGGAVNYFNQLHSQGNKSVEIILRVENGTYAGTDRTNYRKIGEPFILNFENKANDEQPAPVQKQPVMNAPANTSGLSGVEVFRVHHYDTLLNEKAELKAENAQLKKENDKLKDENLRNELLGVKSVEAAKARNEMLALPVVSQLAGLLAGKLIPVEAAAGLAQPASPTMQRLSVIDESFLNELLIVATAVTKNPELEAKFEELLTQCQNA